MKILLTLLLLLHSLLPATTALAGEDLLIRCQATPENPWLGQKVTILIDVLAADGWAQVKTFRDPQMEGGFLLRFETQGTRLNESIGGTSYTGQRYEFLFFAQRPGQLIIPEIPLDIEVKNWSRPAAAGLKRKATPPVTLSVKTVPGAGSRATMVSSSNCRASQQWEPEADTLQVGDAISRSITLTAADVSAMLFSPLDFGDIEGMGVYPGEAQVDDRYARGELTGKRLETVSYVLERPGTFELPDLVFSWWDVGAEKLEEIVLPGRSLTVTGGTSQDSAPSAQPETDGRIKLLLSLSLVALMLIAIAFNYINKIREFYSRQLTARRESESSYFRRIGDASRSGDPQAVLRATMKWLDRLPLEPSPPRLDLFLERYGDNELLQTAEQLTNLDRHGAAGQELPLFYRGLRQARKKRDKEQRRREKAEALLPKIGLGSRERQ